MNNNTIELAVNTYTPILEGISSEIIYPGQLCALTDAVIDTYELNTEEFKAVSPLIAVVNIYQGKTVYDEYPALSRIFIRHGMSGDVFWLLMKAADAAIKGKYLTATADGFVEEIIPVPATKQAFALALEASPAAILPDTSNHFVKAALIY